MRALVAAALALAAAPVAAETPDQVAKRYALAGEMLVGKGGEVILHRGYGAVSPDGGPKHKAGERWRLASITKQVTAALIVRRVGLAALDRPISRPEDQARTGQLTLRQLLTHHTGLANPDASPETADGVPSFYAASEPDIDYCLAAPARPGAAFAYNNCDYILASFVLAFQDADDRAFPKGMRWAEAGEKGISGFMNGKPEPRFNLAAWGAGGALIGTARAVFDFDRALMTGKLLPSAALAELWKPEGNGSYQALGAWVFPAKLKGCTAPKRIVQRDGEIYGVQVRNFILPDDDLVVIVFTNRSADDFAFGQVWQQSGFAFDLLSAAACG
jgi:CubicO group peptidase (beta-lactamase class C family)